MINLRSQTFHLSALYFSGDSVRRTITGPPGPQGPRGQKGERGEPGYIHSQSYSQGSSRVSSERREADVSKLTETLDYSNVALKVTDYIKSVSLHYIKVYFISLQHKIINEVFTLIIFRLFCRFSKHIYRYLFTVVIIIITMSREYWFSGRRQK